MFCNKMELIKSFSCFFYLLFAVQYNDIAIPVPCGGFYTVIEVDQLVSQLPTCLKSITFYILQAEK